MAGRRVIYGVGGGGGGGGSNLNTNLLQNQRLLSSSSSEHLNSLFVSGSSPSFLGSRSMVSFEDVNGGKRSNRSSFFCTFDQEENGDEDLEEYFNQPEKKRRLTVDQVQFLERNFELENKLEPERKVQLAKEIGLQPRQVAIWFQNRRARWKTKQLEREFEVLQASYNSLKADYDNVINEKEKLKAEVLELTDKLLFKAKNGENSDFSDANDQLKEQSQEPIADSVSEDEVSKIAIVVSSKHEVHSSSKSDVVDSESPHYTDGVHSPLLERVDSSYVFEPEQSDLSQDEEDNLNKSLLPPTSYGFAKIEDADYPNMPQNSCFFGFPVEDQSFGYWSY